MFDRGYWTVFRWRGSPVRLHWSLPLAALLFSRFQFAPAAWLGLIVLVLVHELGHGILVKRYRLEVASIDLHGLGGECRYLGYPSEWQVSVIAWGGVVAQALLVPVGFLVAPWVAQPFVAGLLATFAWTNLWMIGFNLLPIRPLDGADAWRLFGLWRRGRRREHLPAVQARRARRAKTTEDAGKLLRSIERHDEIRDADVDLPDEISEQIDRAVKRAVHEHKEHK